MVGLLFLRVVVYHNTIIRNIFAVFTWDIVIVHEENVACSLDCFIYNLCKPAQFIFKSVLPDFCVGSLYYDVFTPLPLLFLDISWYLQIYVLFMGRLFP